jgi:diguanylate cyclase
MQLRTRIALTFLALLGGVLGVALLAVEAANRANAEREITHQLEVGGLVFERVLDANRRQLAQAAQVLASDFGLREAIATHDAETIASTLENHGARIGASLAELVSLDGRVLANSGSNAAIGSPFGHPELIAGDGRGRRSTIAVENDRLYQLVMVPVRSPLPVAWIVMGFALDEGSVKELAAVTGLDVTLALKREDGWHPVATTLATPPLASFSGAPGSGDLLTRLMPLAGEGAVPVSAVLSRSLIEARKPFDRLRSGLVLIALASLSLSAIAAFWLARNITRPLKTLTEAVARMQSGRYDAPLGIARRDELGTLAAGLERMQQAVDARDREIRTLAYSDRLTGLQNRTAFTAGLVSQLAQREQPVAVALINLRRFRRINECLGYAIGDAVLKQVADRLGEAPPIAAELARVGADHFAACTPLGPGATLERWGSEILERLARPVEVAAQPIDIDTVVGLSSAPSDSLDADELIRCAALAAERARREHLPLTVYDASLQVASREQLSLLGELQRAIDGDELVLALQPKIALRSGELVGAEALLRWRHPERGMLPPAAFLPFAEQAGFIRKLTRWTLGEGARIAAGWVREGRPLNLAINISADDLADEQLDRRLRELLAATHLPSGLLTLELTETGLIRDPERALKAVDALKAQGIKLSIDDFGTGYSSLSYLTRMPVDELKIDRSFVSAIAGSPEATAVVQAAIEMGHSLGMSVVGEGIEDRATARDLAALGCDVGQGYGYAKPMLLDDFEAWRCSHVAAEAGVPEPAPTDTVVSRLRPKSLRAVRAR